MATSLEQLKSFLDEHDLEYEVVEDHDAIILGFGLDPESTTFRDRDGDPHVRVGIQLREEGEFLGVFCPQAWNVDGCAHKAAVFEALVTIQARYKMLRFDYDPNDGEIRPNLELVVEDGELTARQFHRMIEGLMLAIQKFDGVIRHAMTTGEVSFASVEKRAGTPPSSPEIARLRELAAAAGGIEELERIAGIDADADDRPAPDADARGPAPAAETSPPPRPAIRRLWERLFGREEPPGEERRRAG